MMKWLRKHSKRIMVALVLVAMFSFVGGSALVNILSPKNTNPVLLKAFGHNVTNKEIYNAQRDITLYEAIGLPWKIANHNIEPYHWYMLMHEAEDAGIAVTDAEVDRVVEGLTQQQVLGPRSLDGLRRQHSMTMPEIRRTLHDYLLVRKNINRLGGAAAPSEPELRHYVLDTEDKVGVRFVSLDAQDFVDKDRPVSDEEARTQFEKYKDLDPGTGEAGWGYRLPNRVKVQYILADFAKIQPQIQLTQEEVIAYWRANKSKYQTVDYVEEPATTAPTTEPAATQPTKKKVQREKTFSEAKPDVERELRTQKAAKLAEQAMRKARDLLLKPWYEMKPDSKTGFKPIPPEVEAPDYLKNVCDTVSRETGIPLELKETPLLSQEKLASWPDLRGVRLAGGKGAERLPLSEYAFNVPAFLEKKPNRENVPSLQLFQVPDAPLTAEAMGTLMYDPTTKKFAPVEGPTERMAIFRVVQAQEAGVAANIDEVREDVDRDVRLQRAFDAIKPVAEQVCAVAARLGVEQALSLFDELRTKRGVDKAVSPPPFARRDDLVMKRDPSGRAADLLLAGKPTLVPPDIQGVGSSAEFVDACFEMAQPGWKAPPLEVPPTAQIAEATTRPAASPEPVVRALPLEKLHRWYVIELLNIDPVDQQEYETKLRQTAYDALESERLRVLVSNWMRPENIEKRCGYVALQTEAVGRGYEGVQPAMPDFGY